MLVCTFQNNDEETFWGINFAVLSLRVKYSVVGTTLGYSITKVTVKN